MICAPSQNQDRTEAQQRGALHRSFLLFQHVSLLCIGARVGGPNTFNGHFASHILVWFRKRRPHDNWTSLPCVERVVSGSGPKQRRHETGGSGLPPSHQQRFQYDSCYQLNEMGLVAALFLFFVIVCMLVLPTSTCVPHRVVAEVPSCCIRLHVKKRTCQRGDGTPYRHTAGLGRL